MAASIRLLRGSIRFTGAHVKVTTAAAGPPGRPGFDQGRFCCRCLNDSAADRNTHFGFETVPEEEKAKKGEPLVHSPCRPPNCFTPANIMIISIFLLSLL